MEWFLIVLATLSLLPLFALAISGGIKEASEPEPESCVDKFEKTPEGCARITRHKDLGPQIRK